METKPTSLAVAAVKPVSPAAVAAVRPVTPAAPAAASAAPKPAAKPAAKKAAVKKPAAKRPAKRKPAAKKAAPKKAKPTIVKKAAAPKPVKAKAKPKAKRPVRKIAAKKPAAKKPVVKKAIPLKKPAAAFKPAFSSSSASKSSKFSLEGMFPSFDNEAMNTLFGPAAGEMKKLSEKAFGFGKDGADQMAKSADAATRSINEAVAISQDNMEACVECGNIAAELSKVVSEEVFEFSNDLFSKNLDLSKKIFACRTINDMFDLQSKVFKANIDSVFSETAKISEMTFKMASKASAPLNDRVSEVTKRLSKTFA